MNIALLRIMYAKSSYDTIKIRRYNTCKTASVLEVGPNVCPHTYFYQNVDLYQFNDLIQEGYLKPQKIETKHITEYSITPKFRRIYTSFESELKPYIKKYGKNITLLENLIQCIQAGIIKKCKSTDEYLLDKVVNSIVINFVT